MSQNCGTRRVDLSAARAPRLLPHKLPASTAMIVFPGRLAFGEDNFGAAFGRRPPAADLRSRSPAADLRQRTAGAGPRRAPAGPGVSAWNAQAGLVAVRSAQQCPD